MSHRVLVVDDEPSVRDSLSKWFSMEGYQVETAAEGMQALRLLQRQRFDVALVDLRMPGMDGVALQHRLREVLPQMPVIIVTAYGTVKSAVELLKHGAFDYLAKPVDPDELSRVVARALQLHQGADQPDASAPRPPAEVPLIGDAPAIGELRTRVERAAQSEIAVLLCGESGTGKHHVARAIHARSSRRLFPLVVLHGGLCNGDLEPTQALSDAPVGPDPRVARRGKLELASGGTLYLAEVGRLSQRGQAALLDLLNAAPTADRGSASGPRRDFRLIAGSREPLDLLVEQRRFDRDLFDRINGLPILCPPLRERRADVAALAIAFLSRLGPQQGKAFDGFRPAALAKLEAYDWPGNVRELSTAIERAVTCATPPWIETRDLEV